jgi:hypothetical protein
MSVPPIRPSTAVFLDVDQSYYYISLNVEIQLESSCAGLHLSGDRFFHAGGAQRP